MQNYGPISPCAFHTGNIITNFCKNPNCLLPLCAQCTTIHQQQHEKANTSHQMVNINLVIDDLKHTIQKEGQQIKDVHMKINKQWQINHKQHMNVRNQIILERDNLLKHIHQVYDTIILQIDDNTQRRQYWNRQFTLSINNVLAELQGIQQSLNGEKYLRALIMWTQINPHEDIQHLIDIHNAREWTIPNYSSQDTSKLVINLADSQKITVLELDGEFGTRKIIKSLRMLRYGEDRQGGITITDKSIKQSIINNQSQQYSTPQPYNIQQYKNSTGQSSWLNSSNINNKKPSYGSFATDSQPPSSPRC